MECEVRGNAELVVTIAVNIASLHIFFPFHLYLIENLVRGDEMNEVKITDVINATKEAMRNDGLTEEYIESLEYTWQAFVKYADKDANQFTENICWEFLEKQYGVSKKTNFLSLSAVNKRRKRAMLVLINIQKSGCRRLRDYQPCRFEYQYNDAFNAFLDARKQSGLAMTTINQSIYGLNRFSEYLSDVSLKQISDIETKHIVGFIKRLSTEGKQQTLYHATCTTRLLLRFLFTNGLHSKDLSSKVPIVKPNRNLIPSIYKQDEIESMLMHIDRAGAKGKRNYAMVLMSARYGMRASDVCALRFENINWVTESINFNTVKTGKHTTIPLTGEVGNAIIDYLKNGRPATENSHVFVSFSKPYGAVKPSIMHSMVTNAMRVAGVKVTPGKRHGPHSLRASLATEMLNKGIPLHTISEAISHDNSDTTKIYLKVDIEHLRQLSLDVPKLGNIWMGGVPI